MARKRLGIGLIGSGFNARFHLQGFVGVRDADILGVWSPNRQHAGETAALAAALDVGQAKAYRSIAEMVVDPAIDALWLCGPNYARVENMEEIADAVTRGGAELKGVACEKPLARNVAEATSRTRSSHPRSCGGTSSSGVEVRRSPVVPTLHARPRSTAARTCPGSGRGGCRAAESSTT